MIRPKETTSGGTPHKMGCDQQGREIPPLKPIPSSIHPIAPTQGENPLSPDPPPPPDVASYNCNV